MNSPSTTPAHRDGESTLKRFRAIRHRADYQEFRQSLQQAVTSGDYALPDPAEESATASAARWLRSAFAKPAEPSDSFESAEPVEPALAALRDSRTTREAAFHLVERYGHRSSIFRELLLGASLSDAPTLDPESARHLVEMIGLAERQELADVLRSVLLRQYHHLPPAHTAQALARLGLHVDSFALGLSRSISISQSGSTLLIHHDERFTGIGRCAQGCRFFPCRVNRYYLGPIEDCKLFDKVDPDSLLDLRDFRPVDQRGPTVGEVADPKDVLELHHRAAVELQADGKLQEAAEALRLAARFERSANGQLELLQRSARLLIEAGAATTAYRLALLTQDKAEQATDETLKLKWDRTLVLLAHDLGIYGESGEDSALTPEGRELAKLLTRLLRGPGASPVDDSKSGAAQPPDEIVQEIDYALERHQGDGAVTYRLMSYRISWSQAIGKTDKTRRALDSLLVAPSLTLQPIEQEILRARQLAHDGPIDEACTRWLSLLPLIDAAIGQSRRLEYLGYALEALGSDPQTHAGVILDLAVRARKLFAATLSNRSSAPARRRLRQRHQRTIETIATALIQLAESDAPADRRGQALHETWRLIRATRNPELQTVRVDLPAEASRRLVSLEESLHRSLHTYMVDGWELRSFIDQFLRPVLHFEVVNGTVPSTRNDQNQDRDQDQDQDQDAAPARESESPGGLAVMWLGCREPLPEGRVLVLLRHDDRLRHQWIDRPTSSISEITTKWAGYLESMARAGRSVVRAPREVLVRNRTEPNVDPPETEALERATLLLAPFARNQGKDESLAISLYPDDLVNSLALETLPDPLMPGLFLGERMASRYLLRSAAGAAEPQPLRLGSGWLGLGGVPQAPARPSPQQARLFPALPGTLAEVESIAGLLRNQGIGPVETLTGDEAHHESLENRLSTLQPSVLHLAAHGIGDKKLPDACALVLAMEPGGAARTLLPFRLIQRLPLDSVQLVVLSACSSLVGPSAVGTGIEGLAWAFLNSGVDQVVAARYPVDDRHTKRFMTLFYRHLLEAEGSRLSVAEALRRTRVSALRKHAVPLHEVGAWVLLS